MDQNKLENALGPWLSPETWHTRHPKDDERFHQSLNAAFNAIRPNIDAEQFAVAISQVLSKKHPSHVRIYAEDIKEFAQRAEVIGSYLFDLQ